MAVETTNALMPDSPDCAQPSYRTCRMAWTIARRLGHDVTPLCTDRVVAGTAMTINAAAVDGPSNEPYGKLLTSFAVFARYGIL